jgi:hypothetical protein
MTKNKPLKLLFTNGSELGQICWLEHLNTETFGISMKKKLIPKPVTYYHLS